MRRNRRTRRQTGRPASLTEMLVRPLVVECLTYLDEESIRQVCLLSKQFHSIIHNDPKLKHKLVTVLEIRFSDNDIYYEGRNRKIFAQKLSRHRNKLQHYHKVKIIGQISEINRRAIKNIDEELRLQGVVALDMSLPVGGASHDYSDFLCHRLGLLLPNLRELDLSNTHHHHGPESLRTFFGLCSRLKKITWNNINRLSLVTIGGGGWMNCTSKLKEVYMDDSEFYDNERELEVDRMSDLENEEHAGIFLFYKCTSKRLKRISIKNAKFGRFARDYIVRPVSIPQNALIKYIRNAPASLRWFRSDLSDENITMLQKERPEIEFAN